MIYVVNFFLSSARRSRVSFSDVNNSVYLDDSLPTQFVVGGWLLTGKCGIDGSPAQFKVKEVLHDVRCVPV